MLRTWCLVLACATLAVAIPLDGAHPDNVFEHLHALQKIADKFGARSVASGYNASAEYVLSTLKSLDFDVTTQPFVVPVYTENTPPTLRLVDTVPEIELARCTLRTGWQHYEQACDYSGVRYGGDGVYNLKGAPTLVPNGACSKDDFAAFKGGIALIEASVDCDYYAKVINAEDSGASGVILFTPAGTAAIPGGRVFASETWREGVRMVKIPTVGVTNAVGTLLQAGGSVEINTDSSIDLFHTYNIIADSKQGDKDDVAMIGAHLDGVPEGPGINDNGSGTSTVLAVAQHFGRWTGKRTLRFAWWAAEEIGLLGSRHYVRDLVENHPEDLKKVKLYLNFDMEASPNYVRLIYNGTEAVDAQKGSEELMHMFEEHFKAEGLSTALTSMSGGSDFLPFIQAGVPSSGMAAGASGIKSADERASHGGLANAALDPCYHAPCDSIDNVSADCIREVFGAAIDVVAKLGAGRSSHSTLDAAVDSRPSRTNVLKRLAVRTGTSTSCLADDEREVIAPAFD